MQEQKTISLLLRFGLVFVFVYAAVSAFINPSNWIGFLPAFVRTELMLGVFGVGEIILGLWLLSGWRVFYAAILSAIVLAGIVAFNLGALDIVFRDVAIFLMAVALAVLSKDE